ncbi:MAG: amino acid adenylation domain-containing protein, partial [Bacteroidota bacterium]
GDKRLIGYVVMEAELDKAAWKESLEEKLQQSLPEYMVPQLWVKLEEMPLTDNGKIDRKSLPEPDGSDLSTKAYVAPRTEAEAELVEIWQDLLGVEQVGVFDNFFELGGQSLLAIRLIARIQKLGYTVNIKDFYADPSIALLSTKLSAVEEGYQVPKNGIILGCTYITPAMVTLADLSQEELERIMDQVPGGAANIQDIYPLSPLQEGIYFHHLMSDEEHGDPYLYANLLSFSSPELRSEFIKGLRFVIDRHDVFRTCILSTGFSQAIQVVLREVDLPLAELPIAADQEVLPQVEQEIASENLYIDLATAPMLRVKVADDPANETYYLVLNYHHTIMDHVGTAKIREEIALYLSGRSGLLPEPALYRDFIGHTLNKEKLARSEQYFSELYAGIEAPTYPFNLSDTMVDGATPMATSQKMLSSDVRDAIRQVSGDLQMSPAVLFHAAFGLMIGRCSNSEYALFGSVLLGRLQGAKGSDASLGLFMNGLPLLLDLHGDVAAYISQTNERLRALLDHEQTPLSKVHQWSGVANDVPLFSALLNYRHSTQRSSAGDAEQADGSGNKVVSRIQRTNYPFNFDIDDYGDDFRLTATLSNVGIDPSQVLSYMEASLKTILEHADKGSERTVSELSIIPEEEANQVWTRFNDTAAGYPADQTVVDLFREQVKKTPGEVAVVYEQESLSYKELDERSNQLAHYLVSKGVSTDVLVGICVGRGLEMVVGVLGILKSGGAYVPIDSEYPEARIDYLLEDSGVKMVLSSGEHAAAFSRSDRPEVILLDGDWDKISQEPTEQLKSMASPEHLAYVIYTSGSTGQPKGVMNSHEGIVNQLLWTQETYQLSSEDALLQKANFSFDVSVWELLWPLISGARLVLARPGGQGDVAYLKELMESQQVTTIHFVPSMLAAFLTGLAAGDCRTLRRVLCSGEALTGEQVRKFRKLFPEVRFDNLYGPTEAAVHVSSWSVPKDASSLTTVPIGLPVANTSFYILDTSERLVPTGVVGELYIGGDQVARGYLNNESLTKEQFVAHPSNAGDRLYKTGDLAWQLPDGTIEFVGRKDTQVKVRGYRIELGEIENVLASVSGITQSCVLAREDGYVDKRLIGYVVMEGALDKEFLQDQLQQKLPEYMVPRWWVALEEMPLTVNGKLDRKALPDLDHSALLTKGYAAPGTELEMALTEIWQELLGIEKVGIYDNFFELGGHSLLIVHLISSINKRLNAEVPFAFVFKYPTISEFAAHVTADGLSGHETMISLRESGDQKPIFLAPEISGTANSYFELARSLGDNQPVYAFQCPGLDGKSNVSASIEEMAAAFIAEMQKTDPQGPYRLGGYSFGASIALEMALQLRQKGFEVDELLIFDGKIRTSLAPEVKDEDEDFALFLKDLIENYGNAYGWTDLAIEGKSIGAQIDEMHKQVKDTLSKTALKGRLGVVFNNYKLLSSYRPEMEEKLAVQVTLFKAIYRKKGADGAQVVRENSESDYGWNKYTTTEVMVHTLPAEHATILNKAYAEEITGRLNEQKEMSV